MHFLFADALPAGWEHGQCRPEILHSSSSTRGTTEGFSKGWSGLLLAPLQLFKRLLVPLPPDCPGCESAWSAPGGLWHLWHNPWGGNILHKQRPRYILEMLVRKGKEDYRPRCFYKKANFRQAHNFFLHVGMLASNPIMLPGSIINRDMYSV